MPHRHSPPLGGKSLLLSLETFDPSLSYEQTFKAKPLLPSFDAQTSNPSLDPPSSLPRDFAPPQSLSSALSATRIYDFVNCSRPPRTVDDEAGLAPSLAWKGCGGGSFLR